MTDVKEIIEIMKSPNKKNIEIVTKAYNAAFNAHSMQKRLSGEPYFEHVFDTARTLAKLSMGAKTIAAGFLHDTLEDGLITKDDLIKEFGEEVVFLIEGVTKLGKLEYKGVERHVESLRKLFIATAQDMRVLIIRLADRLHNIKTLKGHPSEEKRRRIAIETLEIFSPIANRLGIGKLKGDLEDNAFPYAYPEEYKKTKELLNTKSKVNKKYLEKVRRTLQKELAKQDIKDATTDYRIKRMYSLYKKLLLNNMDIDEIYDTVALRIVVSTVGDCYRVLGIIHNIWRPLPGKIKDYIANPKPNGYQSLHTTIFTGDGGIVEIQIRTSEMHSEAEHGIASHLAYKEAQNKKTAGAKKEPVWIKQLLDWQKNVTGTGEFLNNLKIDFFKDRVFVFTPKGDVIDLPEDSSIIDFAYAVHTYIGNHISSAKVNCKMASLNTKLTNGDIVEIITKESAHPTSKWLKYTKTTLATKRIRAYEAENGSKLKNLLPNIGRHRLF